MPEGDELSAGGAEARLGKAKRRKRPIWLQILNLIADEGPMTTRRIAERLGASFSAVENSLRSLWETGVLKRAYFTYRSGGKIGKILDGLEPSYQAIYYLSHQRVEVAGMIYGMVRRALRSGETRRVKHLIRSSELEPEVERMVMAWIDEYRRRETVRKKVERRRLKRLLSRKQPPKDPEAE